MGYFKDFLSDVGSVFRESVDVYVDVFRDPPTREEIKAAERRLASDEENLRLIAKRLDELAKLLRERKEGR